MRKLHKCILNVGYIKPSAMIESRALGALKFAGEAGDENMPAMRADFLWFEIL